MRRRALLTAAGLTFTGLAGCPDSGDPTMPAPTDTAEPTSTSTDNESPTETEEEESPLDVELQPVEYVVTADRWSRGGWADDYATLNDVPDALRGPLEEALDGKFETDSVSEDLLAAIDTFRQAHYGTLKPYIEFENDVYGFNPTVPTFVAALEGETFEEYDESRVFDAEDQEPEDETVEAFVDRLAGLGQERPPKVYRQSLVPDSVEAFVEEYDYVQDVRGVFRLEMEFRDPGAPYTIEARQLSRGEMCGPHIIEESDIENELSAFLETAVQSDHRRMAFRVRDRRQYFTDTLPDSIEDITQGFGEPLVRVDGSVYRVDFEESSHGEVPVSATVEEETGTPPRFTLTVTPDRETVDADVEGPIRISGDGGLPSVLWVTPEGDRYLLDSPAYEKDGWRKYGLDEAEWRPVNYVGAHLGDGEESDNVVPEVSATYTVPEELPEGTYVARGRFGVGWETPGDSRHGGIYLFELRISMASN